MKSPPSDQAMEFPCGSDTLLGILSPGSDSASTGVVIVVGGPQYRAGSHRQFVQIARAIGVAGFPALRFDVRGMGDSTGVPRDFLSLNDDIKAAIDALQRVRPAVKRVVLWGLCDGASASLLYLHGAADSRVAGLALLNPWVRSEVSLARAHVKYYYTRRLLEADFWSKVLSGKIGLSAVRGLVRSLRAMASKGPTGSGETRASDLPYQLRMAQAWEQFSGEVLLLLSDNDLTAKEFVENTASDDRWQKAMASRPPSKMSIERADHTCSTPEAAAVTESATLTWLRSKFSNSTASTGKPVGSPAA